MSQTLQSLRGMHDILPGQIHHWQWFEQQIAQLMESYQYQEIRTPILENTELFSRSIGDATDIVEKEMYSFVDREKGSVTLRPEFTASCVRSAIQHGFANQQTARLWYLGPLFRHERPQKGRYRQFYQFGVEAFGYPGFDVEAEIILLSARLWKQLGIAEQVELELNSLGVASERQAYRELLVTYFQQHAEQLDSDSQRRLLSNPLRILDSKNPNMQELIEAAPKLHDHLGAESKAHFAGLCALLDDLGVTYRVNPRLVRGLDYYSHTVFEWVTNHLGAQGTVCAGGRYDGLVEQLGGKPCSAIGFGAGIDRLLLLLEANNALPAIPKPDVYIVNVGEGATVAGLKLAETLRNNLPSLKLLVHSGGGSMKSQFKKADRSGANYALVLGEQELAAGQVVLKHLRTDAEQQSLEHDELIKCLTELLVSQ